MNETAQPKHTVTELSEKFETMFGIPIDDGVERVKVLMRRTISMGKFEAGSWDNLYGLEVHSTGTSTINDRDFLMFGFFAMFGIEQFDKLPALSAPADPTAAKLVLLSMNLRLAAQYHPAYKPLVDDLLEDIEREAPKLRMSAAHFPEPAEKL